jgi:DNA-binding CsgD family transcriptional regulator
VLQGEDAANQVTLSSREKEVLDWLQQGKSSWEVSVILAISESTVNFHVSNIKRKLGATNRAQALAIAARLGLLRCE